MDGEGDQRGAVLPERRRFLVGSEIPGLLAGSLRGDSVALRRILGARRGGRIGAGLALAALALAAQSWGVAGAALALWLILSALGTVLHGEASGLGLRQWLRLSLWTTASALLAAALLRVTGAGSVLPALAVVAGYALLWRGVRRGLG